MANDYLGRDNRASLLIHRKAAEAGEGEPEDPQMARFVQMIESMDDPEKIGQMIGMFASRIDEAEDPGEREQTETLLEVARARLAARQAPGDE